MVGSQSSALDSSAITYNLTTILKFRLLDSVNLIGPAQKIEITAKRGLLHALKVELAVPPPKS